jgi:hypothetical protein
MPYFIYKFLYSKSAKLYDIDKFRRLEMLSYCTNYLATMPDITVYMNCDTRLAINLSMFELSEYDEFIFAIKNFSYVDSSYAFLFRARKEDMDERGEIIFNIDPDASKKIRPGAFYNFSILVNAFNPKELTEYKKLTENGKVNIEYGAQDLALPEPEAPASPFNDILAARLEPTNDISSGVVKGTIIDVRLDDSLEEATHV